MRLIDADELLKYIEENNTEREWVVNNYNADWIWSFIDSAPTIDADYLLANGVVVSPCKVGDTVYDIYEAFHNGEGDVRALKVTDIHIHLDKRNKAWIIIGGYYFALDDFGKTVFLTREEAERALAKRKGGDE